MLLLGDCNHWLKEIKDDSIDLLVTDPPYGITFMGKDWDKALVSTETWKECYRVLKQGKLAFVMCSPRQDVLARMIIHLQDAGFRTNYTSIYWTYASGFPKAANVSKLIDKKPYKSLQQQIKDFLESAIKQSGKTKKQIDYECGFTACRYSSYVGKEWGENLPTKEKWEKMKAVIGFSNQFDNIIEEAEREVIGKGNAGFARGTIIAHNGGYKSDYDITKPATEEAKKMEGAYVGFQPKPAVEVILVVSKGKTLTWLDDCRIPYQSEQDYTYTNRFLGEGNKGLENYRRANEKQGYDKLIKIPKPAPPANEKGRFPANLLISDNVLDDSLNCKCGHELSIHVDEGDRLRCHGHKKGYQCECKLQKQQKGRFPANLLVQDDVLNNGHNYKVGDIDQFRRTDNKIYGQSNKGERYTKTGDSGSYSRYFSLDAWSKTFPFLICPKASKAERDKGCESLPLRHAPINNYEGRDLSNPKNILRPGMQDRVARNTHPTVKPLKLMSYLITMGSREGDLVLDPFCGSGTVCIAADNLHRKWLGIERNEEYAEIIKKRLMVPLSQLKMEIYQ